MSNFTCTSCGIEYWVTSGQRRSKGLCSTCYRTDVLSQGYEVPDGMYQRLGAEVVCGWLVDYHPDVLADLVAEYGLDSLVGRLDGLVGQGGGSTFGLCILCDCDVFEDFGAHAVYRRRMCPRCYSREYRAGRRGGYDGLAPYPSEAYWKEPARYAWYLLMDQDAVKIIGETLENYTPAFVKP